MRARGLVDVLIPRGGAGLIRSRGRGLDGPGDRDRRRQLPRVRRRRPPTSTRPLAILLNAKTQRPSVCNAAETFLVHAGRRRAVPAAGAGGAARRGRHGARRRARRVVRRRPAWPRAGDRRGLGHASTSRWTSPPASSTPTSTPRCEHIRRCVLRAHRGDRHRVDLDRAAVRRRRRLGGGAGQRLDPVHRRRRVRLRRRDRHLHPEAARPRPDGPGRADHARSTS